MMVAYSRSPSLGRVSVSGVTLPFSHGVLAVTRPILQRPKAWKMAVMLSEVGISMIRINFA